MIIVVIWNNASTCLHLSCIYFVQVLYLRALASIIYRVFGSLPLTGAKECVSDENGLQLNTWVLLFCAIEILESRN